MELVTHYPASSLSSRKSPGGGEPRTVDVERGGGTRRAGPERNVTTPNCLIPGRAMRELIGNTGARGCVHAGRMLGETATLSRLFDDRGIAHGSRDTSRLAFVRARAKANLGFTIMVICMTSTSIIFNYQRDWRACQNT